MHIAIFAGSTQVHCCQNERPEEISGRSRVHGRGQGVTGRRCFRALPPAVLQDTLGKVSLSCGMETVLVSSPRERD